MAMWAPMIWLWSPCCLALRALFDMAVKATATYGHVLPHDRVSWELGIFNIPAPPAGPGDPQAHAHMRGGGRVPNHLPSQLVQPTQPPKPMGASMLPWPTRGGWTAKPGSKGGGGNLNAPPHPAGLTPTLAPAPVPLSRGLPTNPLHLPMVPAPPPTPAPAPPPPGGRVDV
ncbi:hypothetical protein BC826DRAFT_974773 [Russula brevipes]|nr:hypothetical protein BC826DRAFT_974773 [Russula brevipes]